MTVHTICDQCGMEYDHAGITLAGHVYCCAGCANGGPCTCAPAAVVSSDTAVIADTPTTVLAEGSVPDARNSSVAQLLHFVVVGSSARDWGRLHE